MDSIPIECLKAINSISAVKLLISFLHKTKESTIVEYSILDIAKDLSCSRNTARSALNQLIRNGLIIPVDTTAGKKPNTYKVSLEREKEDKVIEGWTRVTATSREEEQKQEIEKQTKEIDFKNMDFLDEDINSMRLNNNVFMHLDEIKKLSHRLVTEFYYQKVIPPKDNSARGKWIAIQKRICTDLLVKYRTVQVCAAITYWVEIKGLVRMNLMFLHNEKKMTEALDYYKRLYLETRSHDDVRNRADEAQLLRQIEKEKEEQERVEVESMTDDDFIKKMLSGMGG
jgi:predicted transcriptional regulator